MRHHSRGKGTAPVSSRRDLFKSGAGLVAGTVAAQMLPGPVLAQDAAAGELARLQGARRIQSAQDHRIRPRAETHGPAKEPPVFRFVLWRGMREGHLQGRNVGAGAFPSEFQGRGEGKFRTPGMQRRAPHIADQK